MRICRGLIFPWKPYISMTQGGTESPPPHVYASDTMQPVSPSLLKCCLVNFLIILCFYWFVLLYLNGFIVLINNHHHYQNHMLLELKTLELRILRSTLLLIWRLRNWVFGTNSDFLKPIFFPPDDVNLWYFKLIFFHLPEFIVWNI